MPRIITKEVRLSYVHLLEPYAHTPGQAEEYCVTVLLPKSDMETKALIDRAIEQAKQEGAKGDWGGVIPPIVPTPIYDGNGNRPSDGMPYGEECKDHWVFTTRAKTQNRPQIVGPDLNNISDPSQIYSGMYGKVSINIYPYTFGGKKGIGFGLGNVQKLRDGDPLGGGRVSAEDEFAAAGSSGGTWTTSDVKVDPITGQPIE